MWEKIKLMRLTSGWSSLEGCKFCIAPRKQTCITISETKAAFSEQTKRSIFDQLPQLVTKPNAGGNHLIDLRIYDVKYCDFVSNLYHKPLRQYRKPNRKFDDFPGILAFKQDLQVTIYATNLQS